MQISLGYSSGLNELIRYVSEIEIGFENNFAN